MRALTNRSRWLLGLGPATWFFVAAVLASPFVLIHNMQQHAAQEALRQANSISAVMAVVRSYYLKNVVGPVQRNGGRVTLTEDYRNIHGGIPIPATLSIELGEAIRERNAEEDFAFRFVSDRPFQGRQRASLDAFQTEALNHFRAAQGNPAALANGFWRVESGADRRAYVRMAMPILMEAGCVACHNSPPDSPVRDWQVADVRGIEEVAVAVDPDGQFEDSVWLTVFLVLFGASGVLALREYQTGTRQLLALNAEIAASRTALEDKSATLEQSVRELRTKTTVLDKAPFSILVLDPAAPDTPVQSVNEAFARVFGYAPAEVIGRHPRFLFGAATDATAAARVERALREYGSAEVEMLNHARSGELRRMRWLVFPSLAESGALLNMVVCLTDVTEVRAAEDERQRLAGELQESMKLESLGLTIAGIAHDLNTPIGIAVTASTLLQQDAEKLIAACTGANPAPEGLQGTGERIRRAVEMVTKNLAKAAQLVQSFKQTSADATRNEWRVIDLRDLLESLIVTLSPIMRRAACAVSLSCPPRLSLYTEPGSISQAITNLLVNASLHAFDGRDERRLEIEVIDLPDAVAIRVADNGNGLSEEAAVKAFTPFFTTRRASGGSGLGLFSTRRAIEQNLGGRVTLQNHPGCGATFNIYIPKKALPKPAETGRQS